MARATPRASGPLLLPLILVGVGGVVLLQNFLVLPAFNLAIIIPLLLIVAGGVVLWRGDLVLNSESRPFGITRGSSENASLEVNAAEIDVTLHALETPERLIAGHYAVNTRPELLVEGKRVLLRFDRARTPWYAQADWELVLAPRLPWQIVMSTSLGQIRADLTSLVIDKALISTGVGDIHLVAPYEAASAIALKSTAGNVHVITPPEVRTRITVLASRLFGIHVDETRYEVEAPGVYVARSADSQYSLVEIIISGTTGDAYLA